MTSRERWRIENELLTTSVWKWYSSPLLTFIKSSVTALLNSKRQGIVFHVSERGGECMLLKASWLTLCSIFNMAGYVCYDPQIKTSNDLFSMVSILIRVALRHVQSGLIILDPNRCDLWCLGIHHDLDFKVLWENPATPRYVYAIREQELCLPVFTFICGS